MKKLKNLSLQSLLYFNVKGILTFAIIGFLLLGCDKGEEIAPPVNNEPSCTITSPHEGDEIDNYNNVIIEVDADDNDGFITEVRFYINGLAAGSSNSFPYTYVLENPSIGTYEIKATALDAEGGSTSDQINVTITNIQDRLDRETTPFEIFQINRDYLDSLYGKMYQGGLIFHLDTIDGTGLIVAPEDQNEGIDWAEDLVSTGAKDGRIGMGQTNTATIVSILGSGNYAAKLCDDLNLNGYSDWFLPTPQEFITIARKIKNEIPENIYYWSSQEYSSTNAFSCATWGEGGGFFANTPKKSLRRVRAIRAF